MQINIHIFICHLIVDRVMYIVMLSSRNIFVFLSAQLRNANHIHEYICIRIAAPVDSYI